MLEKSTTQLIFEAEGSFSFTLSLKEVVMFPYTRVRYFFKSLPCIGFVPNKTQDEGKKTSTDVKQKDPIEKPGSNRLLPSVLPHQKVLMTHFNDL